MPILNKEHCINHLSFSPNAFQLPERVLQFGTGVLLRGLVDYLIDKANKQNIFNGRVVVVKTTSSDASDFDKQDGVYTLNERGIEKDDLIVNQSIVISAISRILNAGDEWKEILLLVENPELEIIISNTTESGIQYVEEDIFAFPPKSFPAKLTAILFKRWLSMSNGLIIVPTELIVGNGDILKSMVIKHAEREKIGDDFINWLNIDCRFCNSLVDRIVSGAPSIEEKNTLETQLGYQDNLLITSESFLLWAIEGDATVKEKLSFAQTDARMVVAEDIYKYREQKLRLLNGGHTFSVPLAFLCGLKTVSEMMQDDLTARFTESVIKNEILKTLDFDASEFAGDVVNRFKNPFIEHKLTSILWQSTKKMNARNTFTIEKYFQKFKTLPPLMTLGFAAFLLRTKPVKEENEKYFGQSIDGSFYLIEDDFAEFFYIAWSKTDIGNLESLKVFVGEVLNEENIFDKGLKNLPLFSESIARLIFEIKHIGIRKVTNEQLKF